MAAPDPDLDLGCPGHNSSAAPDIFVFTFFFTTANKDKLSIGAKQREYEKWRLEILKLDLG